MRCQNIHRKELKKDAQKNKTERGLKVRKKKVTLKRQRKLIEDGFEESSMQKTLELAYALCVKR